MAGDYLALMTGVMVGVGVGVGDRVGAAGAEPAAADFVVAVGIGVAEAVGCGVADFCAVGTAVVGTGVLGMALGDGAVALAVTPGVADVALGSVVAVGSSSVALTGGVGVLIGFGDGVQRGCARVGAAVTTFVLYLMMITGVCVLSGVSVGVGVAVSASVGTAVGVSVGLGVTDGVCMAGTRACPLTDWGVAES